MRLEERRLYAGVFRGGRAFPPGVGCTGSAGRVDGEQSHHMSSLRAQVAGDGVSATKPLHEVKPPERIPEPVRDVKPAARPAEQPVVRPNRGVGIIAFAAVLAAFWAGSSSAFLRG